MIRGKRILISGMAGTIGSELARQLSKHNKIFGLDINETALYFLREQLKQQKRWVHSRTGDIRDKETLADVFEDFKPQYVFHAAALKNVQPCEEYPIEAIKTNILGTYNLIYEAKKWECLEKFVFISTDKVVNANCKMGITKLCAESLVKSEGKGFIAVRFGNVLGSSGSLLQIWENQYKQNLPLTITDLKMERYFMTIEQACGLVIKAAESGIGGQTFILDMGKPKRILDLKNELYGDYPYKVIGIRSGETLEEKLITAEEQKHAVRKGKFCIINGKGE